MSEGAGVGTGQSASTNTGGAGVSGGGEGQASQSLNQSAEQSFDTGENAQTEAEKVSNRDMWKKKYREAYPDHEFSDENEDTWYEIANKRFDEHNEIKEKYKKTETAAEGLKRVFNTYPEALAFIRDLDKSGDFAYALSKNFDPDTIKPLEGEPDWDAFEKGKKERMERLKQQSEYQAKVAENIGATVKVMQEFTTKNNIGEQEGTAFVERVASVLQNAIDGNITEETLTLLYKGLNKDQEVKEAKQAGEIEGRNAAIDAKKVADATQRKGDGLPKLNGGGTPVAPKEQAQSDTDSFWLGAMDKTIEKQKIFSAH